MIACPDVESLRDLVGGDLPPDSASSIVAHVETCPTCLTALDRLSGEPALDAWLTDGLGAEGGATARRAALDDLRAARTRARPDRIGPYQIERELGRGGMGIVYLARDHGLGRLVALKVLRDDPADERARRRFVREVRAAAQVEHDHLVRVYATADPTDPVLYFAMEYVAGPSLAARLEALGRLGPREAAEVVAQAASGLAAAHAAGLVHRDVKPDNILIDAETGRARLGDFGLARDALDASDLTRDGAVAGTPAYLSPEQARGAREVGPLADVYALGVTLYETIVGEPPFRGEPHRVVHQILHDEPRRPRTLNNTIPRDLETIALKAMAKEPLRRYASAGDLADDLRRYLRGEPITARPVGPAARLARLARREPAAAALAGSLALALVAGTAASVVLWRRAEAGAAHARVARADAERNFRRARDAVDKLYFRFFTGDVLNKPGLQSARAEIGREILTYYRDFLDDRGDDPTLRAEIADASLRVGLMTADLGDKRDALDALRHARDLLEALVRDAPRDDRRRRDLALCRSWIGNVLGGLGRHAEAIPEHLLACDLYAAIVADAPDDPAARRLLALAYGNLANARAMTPGRQAEAADAYRLAGEQFDRLLRDAPNRISALSDLAMNLNNMSLILDVNERVDPIRRAVALRESIVAARPDDPYAARNLARSRSNLAGTLRALGRVAEALPLFQAARDALRDVCARSPNVGYRAELAEATNEHARALLDLGRPGDALDALRESSALVDDLARIDPEGEAVRRLRADAHAVSAPALERLGRLREALDARRSRLALLARYAKAHPEAPGAADEAADEARSIEALAARVGNQAARADGATGVKTP